MQFIRFAKTAESGKQALRKPERTSVRSFFEHLLRIEQLAVARRAVLHSHRHLEGQPQRIAEEISSQLFDLLRQRRRHREAAIANNLSRHNLPNLPVRLRV